MRVTENLKIAAAMSHAARSSHRLLEATRRASSGLAVEKPSDDPAAYAVVRAHDARIAQFDGRLRAITRAQNNLEAAEGTLASASEIMVRAREVAVQLANGEYNAADRQVGANEIGELREALIGLSNSRGPDGGYLFAGTATTTEPFTPAGAFAGNDGVIRVEVADGSYVASNASGATAFTAAGGRDLFQDLADLQATLAANDPAGVSGMIDVVDTGHRQLVGARSDAGLALDRLVSAGDVTRNALVGVQKGRATVAEADVTATFSELAQAQAAYQRSLEVTRQLLSLSLAKQG